MKCDIELVKKLALDNNIKWNGHAAQRMIQRSISRGQVIDVLSNGDIIEEYPEDYPYPSCLVFGYDSSNEPLHVVCSIGQDYIWIITAYKPDNIKWHKDFKTRRSD